jgi:hypothetical protein
MRRALLCLLLVLAALAAGCDSAPDAADEVRERLVGSWLRDYEENGTRVRRVLVLEPDGRFREMSRSLGPQELGQRHAHEGEWLYDGTNLKRRYTLMDGQPVSAPQMPFVAFQIRFTGSHEFTGTDNVRRRELRYQRVPAGTEP